MPTVLDATGVEQVAGLPEKLFDPVSCQTCKLAGAFLC